MGDREWWPNPVLVRFTESDRAQIEALAKARQDIKDLKAVATRKVDPSRSDLDLHLLGVRAEWAVAVVLDLDVDRAISPSGDDKIADMRFCGKTIQVKGRTYDRYPVDLFLNTREEFRADIAVQAIVKADWAYVTGWITREEFLATCRRSDYGYGTRFSVSQDRLHPIHLLIMARELASGCIPENWGALIWGRDWEIRDAA